MSITLGAHTKVGGSSGGTTGAIDTTGASFLCVSISGTDYGGTGPAITDSKSNTYSPRTAPVFSGLYFTQIWYVANPTVGTGHTFTFTTAGVGLIMAAAFLGVAVTSPYDVENGTTGSAQTLQPGSITPGENDEVLITCSMGDASGNVPTVGSGYTIIESNALVGGVNPQGGMAYLIQTSAAASNPTWDGVSSNIYSAAIASFKTQTESVPHIRFNNSGIRPRPFAPGLAR